MHRRFDVPRLPALMRFTFVAGVAGLALSATPREAYAQKKTQAATKAAPAVPAPDGAKVFATTCAACHQPSGLGLEGTYPPLVGSEWVSGDEAKLVRIVLHGLTGPVEVAGETYAGVMPGWALLLKDPEIAAVLTYVRSSWGNKAAPVKAATVTTVRNALGERTTPWTVAELAQAVPAKK